MQTTFFLLFCFIAPFFSQQSELVHPEVNIKSWNWTNFHCAWSVNTSYGKGPQFTGETVYLSRPGFRGKFDGSGLFTAWGNYLSVQYFFVTTKDQNFLLSREFILGGSSTTGCYPNDAGLPAPTPDWLEHSVSVGKKVINGKLVEGRKGYGTNAIFWYPVSESTLWTAWIDVNDGSMVQIEVNNAGISPQINNFTQTFSAWWWNPEVDGISNNPFTYALARCKDVKNSSISIETI